MARVEQVEQVEVGLQNYVEQVEQEQGGLQIDVNKWVKNKGSVQLNLSTWPKVRKWNCQLEGRTILDFQTLFSDFQELLNWSGLDGRIWSDSFISSAIKHTLTGSLKYSNTNCNCKF